MRARARSLFRTRTVPIQLRQSLARSTDTPANQIKRVLDASNAVLMLLFFVRRKGEKKGNTVKSFIFFKSAWLSTYSDRKKTYKSCFQFVISIRKENAIQAQRKRSIITITLKS